MVELFSLADSVNMGAQPPTNGFPPISSWANVMQTKKSLKVYDLNVSNQDGVNSMMVLDEVFKDFSPLWEDFLIGRFLAIVPHVTKIHAIVNKIWAMRDKSQIIEVFKVNSTTMKFQISTPVVRNKVLRRDMWNLAGLVISKWTLFAEEVSVEVKSVPLWVHIKNVPMDMFS